MRFAALLCVLGVSVLGCGPSFEKTVPGFKAAVQDHIRKLADEGQQRRADFEKDRGSVQQNPLMPEPTGTVYDTYEYDPEGFVVLDYSCRVCQAKLVVTAPALEYLCPSCGHSPYLIHSGSGSLKTFPCEICMGRDGKPKPPGEDRITRERFAEEPGAKVKPMFELTSGEGSKDLAAKVRYVRTAWVYDANAAVPLPAKVLANSKGEWIPTTGGMNNSRPGFHRLDAAYLGEIEFSFRGGRLVIVSATERPTIPCVGYRPAP